MADSELKRRVHELIQNHKGPEGLLEEEIAEKLGAPLIRVKDALFELSRECPHCGKTLEEGSRQCPHCKREVYSGKVGFFREN